MPWEGHKEGHKHDLSEPCGRCGHNYGLHRNWDKGPCSHDSFNPETACDCPHFVTVKAWAWEQGRQERQRQQAPVWEEATE